MRRKKAVKSLVRLEKISLIRGGRKVLHDITWEIRRGDHWFILGENGSGKSSLLEVLMGYLWPCDGTVSVLGERYGKTDLPELRKKIGFVAPWISRRIKSGESVREVLAGGLKASIRYYENISRETESQILRKLKQMDALHLKEKSFDKISSGEQLKVLIARALMPDPEILILDEPFSALDLGSRARIYELLQKVSRGRKSPAIVLVTHQLDDILPFFTHGLALKNGRPVMVGKKEKVLTGAVLHKTFGGKFRIETSQGRFFIRS
jgi:iron complex transport system ATP-binding protein